MTKTKEIVIAFLIVVLISIAIYIFMYYYDNKKPAPIKSNASSSISSVSSSGGGGCMGGCMGVTTTKSSDDCMTRKGFGGINGTMESSLPAVPDNFMIRKPCHSDMLDFETQCLASKQ